MASISFICFIPSAWISLIWFGSFLPPILFSSAGIRLSNIKVVFPEPETPVTTVNLPFGNFIFKGFTVWILFVDKLISPFLKISSLSFGRIILLVLFDKNFPILELGFFMVSSIVPSLIIWPPFTPESGPNSIIQSASDKICVSWSTNITELPSATKSCITAFNPLIFAGCNPIEGSSRTYNTPVVLFLTERASCILCLSPVERVHAALSRVKYPNPKSINLFAVTKNDSQIDSAIGRISCGKDSGTPFTHSITSDKVILQTSSSDNSLNFGALALFDNLVPLHSGQMSSFKNFSTRFMPFSSFTFARAFSTV